MPTAHPAPRGFHGLEECVSRELNQTLDKTEQKSDWSGTLTPDQLDYAARDADVLLPLHKAMMTKIKAAGLEQVANIENRCLPAMVWLAGSGIAFDRNGWLALAQRAEQEALALAEQLDGLAPRREETLQFDATWNWSSTDQVKEMLLPWSALP